MELSKWKYCVVSTVLFSVLKTTVSLPVPKYTRSISRNTNYKLLFPKIKQTNSPDILFEETVPPVRSEAEAGVPVFDIYNDRIFFREPLPIANTVFGYRRSFPTTTPKPKTIPGFRRGVSMSDIPPPAAGPEMPEIPALIATDSPVKDRSAILVPTDGPGSEVLEIEKQEQVPLAWLQDWVRRNNYTINDSDPVPSTASNSDTLGMDESDEVKIAFQSLFQVPNIKDRSEPKPCPPNHRRTHHGKCVRPFRFRFTIFEEEAKGES